MEKKITLWAARDKDGELSGELSLYLNKPTRDETYGYFSLTDIYDFGAWFGMNELPDTLKNHFEELTKSITFENSPVEVELTIKIKE